MQDGCPTSAQFIIPLNTTNEYQISDHLASLRVGIEGGTQRHIDYDPWGNPTGAVTGERQTFNCQERDRENAFFDLSDRNYDPNLGRFVRPDRLWEKERALSPYHYCANNPERLTDPSGMQTEDNWVGEGGGAGSTTTATGSSSSYWGAPRISPRISGSSAIIVVEENAASMASKASQEMVMKTEAAEVQAAKGASSNPNVLGASTQTAKAAGGQSIGFVVTPKGTAIPVPKGATGPIPADNGKGFKYTGGKGGNGLSPKVSDVRIMDPTQPKGPSPGYPNGYVNYSNAGGQSVNPNNGQTVGKASPFWHLPLDVGK